MTITDRMAAWRRERRVLQRVSRAAWRLEQAERERSWALASARAEGVPHPQTGGRGGALPGAGAPDHGRRGPGRAGCRAGRAAGRGLARTRSPGGDDDAELDGRDLICDRLLDEVGWLPRCAAGVSINPVGTVSSTVPGVTAPTPAPLPTPPAAFWPRRPCESAPDFGRHRAATRPTLGTDGDVGVSFRCASLGGMLHVAGNRTEAAHGAQDLPVRAVPAGHNGFSGKDRLPRGRPVQLRAGPG